jgi:hypothetical protein
MRWVFGMTVGVGGVTIGVREAPVLNNAGLPARFPA